MSLNRKVSLLDGLRYRGQGPMLTFILHRISGLGMLVFVFLHVLASFMANQAWGKGAGIFMNAVYEHWLFQVFIFFCVLFHAVNGLRITILDLWPKLLAHQREAIWLEWVIFLPLYAMAVFVIVRVASSG